MQARFQLAHTHTHDSQEHVGSQRDAFKIKVPHLMSNIINEMITWLQNISKLHENKMFL